MIWLSIYDGAAPPTLCWNSWSFIESSVNFLPILSWTSKYLATHLSIQTDSPFNNSASLYFGGMHYFSMKKRFVISCPNTRKSPKFVNKAKLLLKSIHYKWRAFQFLPHKKVIHYKSQRKEFDPSYMRLLWSNG